MPRTPFHILFLALLPCTFSEVRAAVAPEDCFPQLKEILDAAEGKSPALGQERGYAEEAEAWQNAARSRRMPRVSGYVRLQSQYESRINSKAQIDAFNMGPNAGVSLSVPLFHWGEFPALEEAAKSRSRSARLRESQRLLEVRQTLRRSFMEYQLALKSAAIASNGAEYAAKKEEGLKALETEGLVPQQALVEADLFAGSLREELADSGKRAGDSLGQLRQTSGLADLTVLPADFPDFTPLSDEELESLRLAAASAKIPIVCALEAELTAEDAAGRELASRNRPKIDAVASGGMDYVDEYRENGRYATVPRAMGWAGVQATWTIYDGGEVDAQKAAALARARRLRATLEETRLRQVGEVDGIARDAVLSAVRYKTRLQRLELIKSSLAYMEGELEKGGVSAADCFQRRLDFQKTQLDLLRAGASYMLDIAQLRDIAACANGQ
jgi:outer membrane protein TolC